MKPTRVAINGFGRIGRQTLRAILQLHGDALDVVAVNDVGDVTTNAHLFKYDSNYGIFSGTVSAENDSLVVDGREIKALAQLDPSRIRWAELGVEIVIESTGAFTDAAKARGHIEAGARKVIITAPAKGEDITVVLGVNGDRYNPERHHIISNASCTTNCLAPVAKVLHDRFGIVKGLMTTIHSYTNDQRIQDQPHKDLRRARAAATSVIPTTTGAARAIGLVLPELRGKLDGFALRVPTAAVSVVDLAVELSKKASREEINDEFAAVSKGELKDILAYSDEPLVSVDFKGHPASAIVDTLSTMVVGENLAKVLAWYDNEWGYSCRVAELAAYVGECGI